MACSDLKDGSNGQCCGHSCDGVASKKEHQDGMKWFFATLVVSFLFLLFLVKVDSSLSSSNKEKQLGETLHQLRTAQTTLGSDSIDPRSLISSGQQ